MGPDAADALQPTTYDRQSLEKGTLAKDRRFSSSQSRTSSSMTGSTTYWGHDSLFSRSEETIVHTNDKKKDPLHKETHVEEWEEDLVQKKAQRNTNLLPFTFVLIGSVFSRSTHTIPSYGIRLLLFFFFFSS